jgi:hypothetical protein
MVVWMGCIDLRLLCQPMPCHEHVFVDLATYNRPGIRHLARDWWHVITLLYNIFYAISCKMHVWVSHGMCCSPFTCQFIPCDECDSCLLTWHPLIGRHHPLHDWWLCASYTPLARGLHKSANTVLWFLTNQISTRFYQFQWNHELSSL